MESEAESINWGILMSQKRIKFPWARKWFRWIGLIVCEMLEASDGYVNSANRYRVTWGNCAENIIRRRQSWWMGRIISDASMWENREQMNEHLILSIVVYSKMQTDSRLSSNEKCSRFGFLNENRDDAKLLSLLLLSMMYYTVWRTATRVE